MIVDEVCCCCCGSLGAEKPEFVDWNSCSSTGSIVSRSWSSAGGLEGRGLWRSLSLDCNFWLGEEETLRGLGKILSGCGGGAKVGVENAVSWMSDWKLSWFISIDSRVLISSEGRLWKSGESC